MIEDHLEEAAVSWIESSREEGSGNEGGIEQESRQGKGRRLVVFFFVVGEWSR